MPSSPFPLNTTSQYMEMHLTSLAIQCRLHWDMIQLKNIPIKASRDMLTVIKIPLLLLLDHFYILSNLCFELLGLKGENPEDIQDLWGHFRRLKRILKTSLTMQDIGVFHSLEQEIEKNTQSFLKERVREHKLRGLFMKRRKISFSLCAQSSYSAYFW